MGLGVLAEASPCCPSPLVGKVVVIAYIAGGALVYVWMLFAVVQRFRGRYHRRGAAVDWKT